MNALDITVVKSVALVFAAFFLITVLAFLLAQLIVRKRAVNFPPPAMSVFGGLYSLTSAFLLSYVIFQVAGLKTEIAKEVATINKLVEVVSNFTDNTRLEARRLIFDYAHSVASAEATTIKTGARSEDAELALQRLEDFFAPQSLIERILSEQTALGADLTSATTAETNGLVQTRLRMAQETQSFLFDLLDAREKRFVRAAESFPVYLWIAFAVMYFALTFTIFVTVDTTRSRFILAGVTLLSCPVPPVLFYLYSNPFNSGLIDLGASFSVLLNTST